METDSKVKSRLGRSRVCLGAPRQGPAQPAVLRNRGHRGSGSGARAEGGGGFAIPRIYPSLQAIAEARPEVIHVLTPPATHAALVLEGQADVANGAIFQLVDPKGIRQKDYVESVRRSGRRVRVSSVPIWFLMFAEWGAERCAKS